MSPMSPLQPPVRHGLRGRAQRAYRFAQRDIWHVEVASLSRPLRFLTRSARVVLIAVRGFFRDRCLQQAAALTYGTIFSLPPVLAFAFAAAKGFNLYDKLRKEAIEPFLDSTFGKAADGAAPEMRQAVDQIFTYVENSDLSALGGVAFAFVVYSVLKLLGAVEGSLNDIWGVKRARTLLRRVSDYLAIVVIAPVFLLLGLTATAFLEGYLATGRTIPIGIGGIASVRLLPLLAVWFGLGFVYLTLPNTRVRISSALIGGVVAGTIWQGIQVLHVAGQIHLANFNTIYASFAAIPMLLLWIYLSWSVFLVGAELAFAHQNEPAFTSMARTGPVDQAFRERIATRIAGRIARAFLQGKPAPSSAELAAELGVAPRTVAQVLESLCAANLLAPTSIGVDDGYLPARDPETITVLQLLTALRHDEDARIPPARDKLDERSDRILAALDEECRRSLHNYTLRELASTREESEGAPEAPGIARAAGTPS
jgi:membrane protein